MLSAPEIERILDGYIQTVVPAMLRRSYHLLLAKGGPEYSHLSEQSHFTHIINGVFGLTRLVRFMMESQIPGSWWDGPMFRRGLALYTVHEVHKSPNLERLGASEFSIPLERLEEEYRALGLDQFAGPMDAHLLRAANVHKRSTHHGDLLLSGDPQANRLWLLVRLADTIASARTPEEAASSLAPYLAELSPVFSPHSPPGRYALYYHRMQEVRGVLTNTVHQAIAHYLAEKMNFYPLLYFATGTLYLGPSQPNREVAKELIPAVTDQVLRFLAQGGDDSLIRDGRRPEKFDFQRYVHILAPPERLLGVVYEEVLASRPNPKEARNEIDGLSQREGLPPGWRDTVEERLGISLSESETFNKLWSQVRRYLLYVDTLIRDLNPAESRLEWFLQTFAVPSEAAGNLRREAELWSKGGIGKYVLVIAYHFLRGPDFAERPAETLPPAEVLDRLHQRVLTAMQKMDTESGRKAVVAELGLREDLEAYLGESLYLSFDPITHLASDGLAGYIVPKRRSHTGEICSLCNRSTKYVQELRTGILDDFGRVFSNRVLPAMEAPQGNRLWCPICHLEAILRKKMGLGLPSAAHYKNSRRIYLYVLPTFSFTPEHLRLFEPLLKPFHRVTALPVRDYGKEWGLPHYWLVQREFNPEWTTDLQDILDQQAARLAEQRTWSYGERMVTSQPRGQPHYYLITWEKYAGEREKEDTRIPTHTEAWAKAVFAAAVISGLTSCKVYVTERPYLPVADPAEMRATIILDGPPPVLRGLLGGRTNEVSLYGRERGRRSGLEQVMDLSAALWVVTTNLRPGKDKDIAGRLERVNVDPLAGAHFYKEYGRENDGQFPPPPFDVACGVLLEIQGGELMDLVEKIARKSLEIALPFKPSGRGKARQYELIFRETVSAMRKAQQTIPEMRQAAFKSQQPSEQSIVELKRLTAGTLLKGLERRQEGRRGEIFVHARGEELNRLVTEFVDIVVDELYLRRAGGNFARFLRLENTIADGIYYYIDHNLSQAWANYKQSKPDQNGDISS